MIDILPYLPIPIVLLIVVIFAAVKMTRPDNGEKKETQKGLKGKTRSAVMRDANRRLAQNPKDGEALKALGDLYYNEGDYEKAMRTFEILTGICATQPNLDEFDITLKYALSCMQMKQFEEAYKSLLIARSMNTEVFEVNYNLGYLEHARKNYEKSAGLLSQARRDRPEDIKTIRYLGYSLFHLKRFKEALPMLRKVMDVEPDDKETLFALAQTFYEVGQNEQAIRIFKHLRPDPVLGPHAALFSGTININSRQFDAAIMDFEIGLKHKEIPNEIRIELQYRLASSYIKIQDLASAITLLRDIKRAAPGYRDVNELLKRYEEMNQNRHLKTFLMAETADYIALCRKISLSYFPNAKVKIVDVSVNKNEYADIIAEISTRKWDDVVIFRYIRTRNQVGELILRDLYSRIKEVKAGRALCLTAGNFSEAAQQFVEARLIDLVEDKDFMKKLNSIQ